MKAFVDGTPVPQSQKTSAAGMYPQGVSPYGVLDMSGDAWEWCLNKYENPERFQEEGDATRVSRGVSWTDHVEFARAQLL